MAKKCTSSMEFDEKDGGLFVVLLHFDLFLLVPFKMS